MGFISFSENTEKNMIAFEEGLALCDIRDPQQQALKWVYSLGSFPSSSVVVVGLGSGFHVAALADLDPHLKITVIETRLSLLRMFQTQFPELQEQVEVILVQEPHDIFKTHFFQEILATKPYVLSFQECWGHGKGAFTQLFAHLTGRSAASVQYHFEELEINVKALGGITASLHSLKDMMPAVLGSSLSEVDKLAFRTLGEMVK